MPLFLLLSIILGVLKVTGVVAISWAFIVAITLVPLILSVLVVIALAVGAFVAVSHKR